MLTYSIRNIYAKGALIALPRRNRLNNDHFEQLLLLKANT